MTSHTISEEQETWASFAHLAEEYDAMNPPHWKDSVWRIFVSKIKSKSAVLDLGCGTARNSELFLSDNLRYVGIDFCMPMLQVARQRFADVSYNNGFSLLGMDMINLAFRDNSFSAFFAAASLLHIPRVKLPSVLTEICRVLEPNAIGLASLPHGRFEGMYSGRSNTGHRVLCVCWKPEDLMQVFGKAGFRVLWWDGESSDMLNFVVQKL